MPRRAHVPAALALATATLSLGLAGCGAADSAADGHARVRRASEQTERAGTARFEIRFVEHDAEGRCDGEVRYAAKEYRVLCRHADSPSRRYEIELLRVGDESYVRYEGDEAPFGGDPGKPWVHLGDYEDGAALDVLDPVALLELLRSATRTTEHLGADEVRGVATERFRLTIDRRLAEELTADEDGPETFPVDVWIGADGVVRRMQTEDPPGASATIEFFDFGSELQIEAPPPAQVAEEDDLEADDAEAAECPGGTTAPLTEDAVKATLGDHGVPLDRLPGGCAGEEADVAVALSNLLFAAGRNGDRNGFVLCLLRVHAPDGAAAQLRVSAEDGRTTFTLANLECSLYPEDERVPSELGRLEDGMRALERTLR